MSTKRPTKPSIEHRAQTHPAGRPESAEILTALAPRGIRLGLETIEPLLRRLGQPQHRFTAVLVTGTNGKGSTAALLAAMATAAGYKTGLFTSPQLEAPEEQVRINGRALAPATLADHLRTVLAAAEEVPTANGTALAPTAFEALTAAAFVAFATDGAELAVLEAGMGGRRDATHAAAPDFALITTVGHDHGADLGGTLAAIGEEKAGVARRGRPLITGPLPAEAATAVARTAEAAGAVLVDVEQTVHSLVRQSRGLDAQLVALHTDAARYTLELHLAGAHQATNLALAVLAAESLRADGWRRLDTAAIQRGAAGCRWPGRLERVMRPDGPSILLDTAHNNTALAALRNALNEASTPFDLLAGQLRDKDLTALRPLVAAARRVLLTRPSGPRGGDPTVLAAHLPPKVEVEPDPAVALDRALTTDHLLVVCGSLRLVGDVRQALRLRYGQPVPAVDL